MALTRHIRLMGLPKYKHNDIAATFDGTYGGVTTRSFVLRNIDDWGCSLWVTKGDGNDATYQLNGFA